MRFSRFFCENLSMLICLGMWLFCAEKNTQKKIQFDKFQVSASLSFKPYIFATNMNISFFSEF